MRRLLACLAGMLFMVSCSQGSVVQDTASLPSPVLYQTRTALPASTPLPALTVIYLPTPTPVVYTVASGDTMSGIALRFNVRLSDLIAANPGVDANAMSVGTRLIIPVGGVIASEPSPTPAALRVRQARCWTENLGGLWCFGLVENDQGVTVEDLSAQFTLLDANGNTVATLTGYGLLNILPAGASMPLAVHFPAPVDPSAQVRMQILTAIRLLPGDSRYLPVSLQGILIQINTSGKTAEVSGNAIPAGKAGTLWILATAYDARGNVVGVRRWEAASATDAGVSLAFHFFVSSLGPGIERVELLAEARP